MDEFPGNSQRRLPPKPEVVEKKAEKNIEKVVSGEVIRRKQPISKRMKAAFLGGDSQSVKDYLILEVLIPNIRDLVADMVNGGVERMIYPDGARRSGRSGRNSGPANHFNYAGISNRNNSVSVRADPRQQLSRQARVTHNFDEVIFDSRVDAEAVLTQMFDHLDHFEVVTVSDFLEMSGISSNFMDHKFGWTDLRGVNPRRTRGGGYILDLPPTEQVD